MYADYIKDMKKRLGWTTEELAVRSGVPTGTINKILSGETKSPRYDTMNALEAVFSEEGKREAFVSEAITYGMSGKYTIEDYYRFPEDVRVELIDGDVSYMEAPTTTHQMAVTNLVAQSMVYIRKKGGDCMPLASPVDVQLDCDEYTMVQPDFTITCDRDKIHTKCIYGAPDFIAEILSPSTRRRDADLKLRKYMAAGVREYWMVDLERRCVISYYEGDDYIPFIYNMDEPVPMKIYGGELAIDF